MTIDVRDLDVDLGSRRVLHAIRASAPAGAITVVLGPNGAGKSTLLRAMAGLIIPAAGAVSLGGDSTPVHRLPAGRRAARLAYVAQRSSVAARFTAGEVIALGRYALPRDESAIERAVAELDLESFRAHPFAELSVGEQQRVQVARALAQAPHDGVLLLDEPTSATDLVHTARVFEVLRRRTDEGAAAVMAVHDLTHVPAVADEVWLLRGGRLLHAGPASTTLRPDTLRETFDTPFEWYEARDGTRLLAPHWPRAAERDPVARAADAADL